MARGDAARHVRGGGPFEPLSPRSQPPERDEDRMERDECVADEERDRQCPSTELIGLSPKDALHDAAPTTSGDAGDEIRSEEHTSELQSLMRISSAVFCLKKKTKKADGDNIHLTKTTHTTLRTPLPTHSSDIHAISAQIHAHT